jgi:serine/threonine protein kinase
MLDGVIKIGDFGLSTKYVNNEQLLMSNDIGTNFYNAPEIDSGFYNEKIDIYSCGKILVELLITTETNYEKHKIIKDIMYNIDNNISNGKYIDNKYDKIIKKSLNKNVDERYNIGEFIYDIKTIIMI